MRVRHMDTPKKVLFFIQFVPVIILLAFLVSCYVDTPRTTVKAPERNSERSDRSVREFEFEYTSLGNGIVLIEFDGHHYLASGGFDSALTHTASCPGVHDD